MVSAVLVLTGTTAAKGQNADVVLDSANNCYLNNDFVRASDLYLRLAGAGYEAPELFYNLGNAYFKQNKIAMAILYFEKAYKLDPYDEDIRSNLEMAYLRTADRIETIPEFFLKKWYRSVYNLLSPDIWAYLSLVFFGSSLAIVFINMTVNKAVIKKMAIPAAIILIIIALCSFVFSLSRRSFIENRNAAIITDISIGVKSSPDMQGTSIFILHEGTRVTILDRLDTWNEIRTGNGNVGWVPESSLTVI